jgi:hypothetical protein
MNDDGLSLEDLMGQLEEVQAEVSAKKLSERNCVEILQTLIRSGLLPGLMYTLDGKEYVTPKQLRLEILAELKSAGGRISIVEMQNLLNVDSTHVERHAREVIKDDPSLQLLGGGSELVSESYIDTIVNEISELLLEGDGHMTVGDLATKYSLTVAFMKKSLMKALGRSSTLGIHMKDGVLYTDGFVKRHECRVRGALSAVTKPISVQKLVQIHQFVDATMVRDTISKLLKAGALHGKLSDNGEYTPDSFGRLQRDSLEEFFSSNGYLPKTRGARLQITDVAKFLRTSHSNVVNLDSCVVGEEIFERLNAVVTEELTGIDGSGWVSVAETLEDIPLSATDVQLLADQCRDTFEHTQCCSTIGGGYLFAETYLAKCREMIDQAAKDHAREAALKRQQLMSGSKFTKDASGEIITTGGKGKVTSAPRDDPADARRGAKGKRRGKKGKSSTVDDDVADVVDEAPSRGKGKRGGGKKGSKRGKKGHIDSDEEDESNLGVRDGNNAIAKPRVTINLLQTLLATHDFELDERCLGVLASFFKSYAVDAFSSAHEEAMLHIQQSNASSTRDVLNALEKSFGTHFKDLEDLARTCDQYKKFFADIVSASGSDSENEEASEAVKKEKKWARSAIHLMAKLEKACVETTCKKIMSIIVGMSLTKLGIDVLDGPVVGDRAVAISDTLSNLAIARGQVDGTPHIGSQTRKNLTKIFEATKAGPSALLDVILDIEQTNGLDLLIKRMDKKEQKAHASLVRKQLLAELSKASSTVDALPRMARCIFFANGMVFPENAEVLDLFGALMLPLPGQILPVHIHGWLSRNFLVNPEDVCSGIKEFHIEQVVSERLVELGATKKLANLDQELFQVDL